MPNDSNKPNYYEVLGVSPTATSEEIKNSFRKLAQDVHPDKQPPGTSARAKKVLEEDFKSLNEAYEVLKDPEQRRIYDRELQTASAELKKQELIRQIQELVNNADLEGAVRVGKNLYQLFPDDSDCRNIYAELAYALAIQLVEAEKLNKAESYFKQAIDITTDEEFKRRGQADLGLLRAKKEQQEVEREAAFAREKSAKEKAEREVAFAREKAAKEKAERETAAAREKTALREKAEAKWRMEAEARRRKEAQAEAPLSIMKFLGYVFGATLLITKAFSFVSLCLAAAGEANRVYSSSGVFDIRASFIVGVILGPYAIALVGLWAALFSGGGYICVQFGWLPPDANNFQLLAPIGVLFSCLAGASISWGIGIWTSLFEAAMNIFTLELDRLKKTGLNAEISGVILVFIIGLGIALGIIFAKAIHL